jgi:hypothetical protein
MSIVEETQNKFNEIRGRFQIEKISNLKKYIIGKNFDEWNLSNHEIFRRYSGEVESILKELIRMKMSKVDEFSPQEKEILRKIRFRFKEDYWTELVQTARRDIEELKNKVNHLLMLNNGTDFLQMAYEEVLFPLFLSGKKKYFGYAHMGSENFYPDKKNIFIKGIDIIKQGQTKIAKEIGMEIISSICSIENDRSPLEIVLDTIPKFYKLFKGGEDINLEKSTINNIYDQFSMTAKNKSPKTDKVTGKITPGNIMVKTFVQRMKEISEMYAANGDRVKAADFSPPEIGDKFEYVVVKKATEWSARGLKKTANKGGKIEFLSVVKKYPDQFVIDIDYYMKNSFAAILARFISYEERFMPPAAILENMKSFESGFDEDEILKYCDKYSIDLAKKWIIEQANIISGVDVKLIKKTEAEHGRQIRKINKMAISAGCNLIEQKIGGSLNPLFSLIDITGKNEIGDLVLGGMNDMTSAEWEKEKEERRLKLSLLKELEKTKEKMAEDMKQRAIDSIDAIISSYNIFEIKKIYEPKLCSKMSNHYQMCREIEWRKIGDNYGEFLAEITIDLRDAFSIASTALLSNKDDELVVDEQETDHRKKLAEFHKLFLKVVSFEYLIAFYSLIPSKINEYRVKAGLATISLDKSNIKKLVSTLLPEMKNGGRIKNNDVNIEL